MVPGIGKERANLPIYVALWSKVRSNVRWQLCCSEAAVHSAHGAACCCAVAIFLLKVILLGIIKRIDAKLQSGTVYHVDSCYERTVLGLNLWIVGTHGHYLTHTTLPATTLLIAQVTAPN